MAMTTYDACVAEIADDALRQLFETNRNQIVNADQAFELAGLTATWCNLPRVPHGHPDTVIAGTLTKQHLMDLYSSYMVGRKGLSRNIYDELLTAAGGICPFCGGLGHAKNLDHYLPKANFPAYSVNPKNLVPCCRDCNTGKNAAFGAIEGQQSLHPYLDQNHFFSERWVRATLVPGKPNLLTFRCDPPAAWSAVDKARVQAHFISYQLAARFSVQAGSEVSKVVEQRAGSLRILSSGSFRGFLLESANTDNFVLNGWNRTTYDALAASDWFVETDFADPAWHLQIPV